MELELKHIAPYFPYELRCEHNNGGRSVPKKISEIWELSHFGVSFENEIWHSFDTIRPILKPINQFDPRTAYIHERMIDFVGLGKWCEAYDEFLDICSNDMANLDTRVLQAPQPIFNYFLSQHYDVFGLIPKGLAVSESEAIK